MAGAALQAGAHEEATAGPCRNCGAELASLAPPADFCPRCGQETAQHPPTLGEFLHEFVGHYVALEGALWRTLGLLLLKPGRLTREYLAGRRRRYVLPLRLYLTASFLFFLVLKLLPSAVNETEVLEAAARPGATVAEVQAAASAAARSTNPVIVLSNEQRCGGVGEPACNAWQRLIRRVGERFRQDPRSFTEHMQAHMMGAAPYAIFLMLPAFAGIVMLAYRSRRMTYGEHFVFSLHLHTFWFLALLAIELLPKGLGDLVQLAVPVYGVLALHEVYRGRWGPTLARSLVISLLYGAVLLAAMAVLIGGLLAAA